MAVKGAAKLAKGAVLNGLSNVAAKPVNAVEKLGSSAGGAVADKVSQKLDESGGPAGILKDAAKSALPFGGDDGKDKDESEDGPPGVGKGRRMPIQQSIDIGLPVETVYNQWTQFEEWPNFMHRVTSVTQDDDCTVSFGTKIWGKSKKFKAKIETQRPDERVKWRVSEGMTHTGVVTFHELGPNLTRVMLNFDVDPGGPLEKLARGARHIKRAARGDLHRFKAFIEMRGRETGAWRGLIQDGKVVEKHDPSYDKQRDYSDSESGRGRASSGRGSSRSGSGRASERSPRARRSSSSRSQASSKRSQGSSSRSQGSSSRSQGSSSRSRGSSNRSQGSSSRSQGASNRRQGSSSRSQGSRGSRASASSRSGSQSRASSGQSRASSGQTRASSGQTRASSGQTRANGSNRATRNSSNSSGSSGSSSSRPRSATRARAASRSNGRG